MNTQVGLPVPPPVEPQAKDFFAAFKRVEGEIRAMGDHELLPVNLDIPSAVATALGAMPEIAAYRAQITMLNGVDASKLDKLTDYAFALMHAHTVYRGASGPVDAIGGMAEELVAIRDQLFSDAQALGKRKLLDLGRVEKYRSGLGFKNLALDVDGLVQTLRDGAAAIAGKTAVTPEELDHAAELASKIIVAIGVKEQAPTVPSDTALVRQQAYTLFVNSYDELRRAITFLRWQTGDADSIAPSLWAGRASRKGDNPEPPPPVVPPPAGAAPSAGPPPVGAGTPAINTPGVGLPGSAPFTH
jgi:hypothetical protein